MRKPLFEETLRAVARVTGRDEVIIIGSQAIHAMTDAAPAEVLMSRECDVLLDEHDPATSQLDGELGPETAYAQAHKVYVDTVNPSFPYLPAGWESRLRDLDVGVLRARCLEVHDLVLSKLVAGRLKDYELIAVLLDRGLAQLATVEERIAAERDLHMRAVLMARLRLVLDAKDR